MEKLMVLMTMCVVTATSVGAEKVHVVNQHTCRIVRYSMMCEYKGEGLYSPDRLITRVDTVKFDFFAKGEVTLSRSFLPDLKNVVVENFGQRLMEDLCNRIFVEDGVVVRIGGKECDDRRGEKAQTTRSRRSSPPSSSPTPTTTAGEDEADETDSSFNPSLTLKIVVIVLAGSVGCILLIIIPYLIITRKRLRTRPFIPDIEL